MTGVMPYEATFHDGRCDVNASPTGFNDPSSPSGA